MSSYESDINALVADVRRAGRRGSLRESIRDGAKVSFIVLAGGVLPASAYELNMGIIQHEPLAYPLEVIGALGTVCAVGAGLAYAAYERHHYRQQFETPPHPRSTEQL